MNRVVLVGVAATVVAGSVLAAATGSRPPLTFQLEPDAVSTFPADLLVPGDRFRCHGALILPQDRGYSWTSSTGVGSGTDAEGDVTIRCPSELASV